jgi:hypothetical protein
MEGTAMEEDRRPARSWWRWEPTDEVMEETAMEEAVTAVRAMPLSCELLTGEGARRCGAPARRVLLCGLGLFRLCCDDHLAQAVAECEEDRGLCPGYRLLRLAGPASCLEEARPRLDESEGRG